MWILIYQCAASNMQQTGQKSNQRVRFTDFLNSLCIGEPSNRVYPPSPSKNKSPRVSLSKPKRMTFLLDRVLLKLSRKNLAAEQFPSEQALHIQIQEHLILRLNTLTIAAFYGNFSDKLLKTLPLSLKIIQTNRNTFSAPIEAILAAKKTTLKLREGSIEAMVFGRTNDSFKLIERVLAEHHGSIDHFVFLIEPEVQAIAYQRLFAVYRDHFLFEVEKLMLIDKCIANAIYISRSGDFLKIDNQTLATYFAQELTNCDPSIIKKDITELLLQLLDAKLHIPTSIVVGELVISSKLAHHHDEEFVVRIQKRYPQTQYVVQQFLQNRRETEVGGQGYKLAQFHENTPEFKLEEMQIENQEEGLLKTSFRSQQNKNMVNVSFGVRVDQQGRLLP